MKCIVHIDLDCFYAQVEARRVGVNCETEPFLLIQWGMPLAVSYPARRFGISRGTHLNEAVKLCPHIKHAHVATYKLGESSPRYHPDASRALHKVSLLPYRNASRMIFSIFKSFRGVLVEKGGVDEAFFDATEAAAEAVKLLEGQFNACAGVRSAPAAAAVGSASAASAAVVVDVSDQQPTAGRAKHRREASLVNVDDDGDGGGRALPNGHSGSAKEDEVFVLLSQQPPSAPRQRSSSCAILDVDDNSRPPNTTDDEEEIFAEEATAASRKDCLAMTRESGASAAAAAAAEAAQKHRAVSVTLSLSPLAARLWSPPPPMAPLQPPPPASGESSSPNSLPVLDPSAPQPDLQSPPVSSFCDGFDFTRVVTIPFTSSLPHLSPCAAVSARHAEEEGEEEGPPSAAHVSVSGLAAVDDSALIAAERYRLIESYLWSLNDTQRFTNVFRPSSSSSQQKLEEEEEHQQQNDEVGGEHGATTAKRAASGANNTAAASSTPAPISQAVMPPIGLDEFEARYKATAADARSRCLLLAAAAITRLIRDEVRSRLGFNCSAGVSINKEVSKCISAIHKPNQQTLLMPQDTLPYLADLPFKKLRGFGGKLGAIVQNAVLETYQQFVMQYQYTHRHDGGNGGGNGGGGGGGGGGDDETSAEATSNAAAAHPHVSAAAAVARRQHILAQHQAVLASIAQLTASGRKRSRNNGNDSDDGSSSDGDDDYGEGGGGGGGGGGHTRGDDDYGDGGVGGGGVTGGGGGRGARGGWGGRGRGRGGGNGSGSGDFVTDYTSVVVDRKSLAAVPAAPVAKRTLLLFGRGGGCTSASLAAEKTAFAVPPTSTTDSNAPPLLYCSPRTQQGAGAADAIADLPSLDQMDRGDDGGGHADRYMGGGDGANNRMASSAAVAAEESGPAADAENDTAAAATAPPQPKSPPPPPPTPPFLTTCRAAWALSERCLRDYFTAQSPRAAASSDQIHKTAGYVYALVRGDGSDAITRRTVAKSLMSQKVLTSKEDLVNQTAAKLRRWVECLAAELMERYDQLVEDSGYSLRAKTLRYAFGAGGLSDWSDVVNKQVPVPSSPPLTAAIITRCAMELLTPYYENHSRAAAGIGGGGGDGDGDGDGEFYSRAPRLRPINCVTICISQFVSDGVGGSGAHHLPNGGIMSMLKMRQRRGGGGARRAAAAAGGDASDDDSGGDNDDDDDDDDDEVIFTRFCKGARASAVVIDDDEGGDGGDNSARRKGGGGGDNLHRSPQGGSAAAAAALNHHKGRRVVDALPRADVEAEGVGGAVAERTNPAKRGNRSNASAAVGPAGTGTAAVPPSNHQTLRGMWERQHQQHSRQPHEHSRGGADGNDDDDVAVVIAPASVGAKGPQREEGKRTAAVVIPLTPPPPHHYPSSSLGHPPQPHHEAVDVDMDVAVPSLASAAANQPHRHQIPSVTSTFQHHRRRDTAAAAAAAAAPTTAAVVHHPRHDRHHDGATASLCNNMIETLSDDD